MGRVVSVAAMVDETTNDPSSAIAQYTGRRPIGSLAETTVWISPSHNANA